MCVDLQADDIGACFEMIRLSLVQYLKYRYVAVCNGGAPAGHLPGLSRSAVVGLPGSHPHVAAQGAAATCPPRCVHSTAVRRDPGHSQGHRPEPAQLRQGASSRPADGTGRPARLAQE